MSQAPHRAIEGLKPQDARMDRLGRGTGDSRSEAVIETFGALQILAVFTVFTIYI